MKSQRINLKMSEQWWKGLQDSQLDAQVEWSKEDERNVSFLLRNEISAFDFLLNSDIYLWLLSNFLHVRCLLLSLPPKAVWLFSFLVLVAFIVLIYSLTTKHGLRRWIALQFYHPSETGGLVYIQQRQIHCINWLQCKWSWREDSRWVYCPCLDVVRLTTMSLHSSCDTNRTKQGINWVWPILYPA